MKPILTPSGIAFAFLLATVTLFSNTASGALPTGTNAAGQLQLTSELAAQKSNVFAYVSIQNGIQFRVGDVVKNVLFYSPGIVRINASLGEPYTTQPSLTVVLTPPEVPFQAKDSESNLELSSAELRVVIDKKTGAVAFLHLDGSEITRERADQPAEIKKVTISNEPTYEVKQNFTLSGDESLYGLGQYNQRYMDYRGQQVLMVQTNIGMVVPLLVSTRRYGIMWDIYSKSIFKDDATGTSIWAESAPAGVDYYFIAGKTMDGVIAAYRQLTGAAPMFPKSAFGLWMSKERYKTQDRLIEVVKTYRKEGIPIDNIVQDWQYWGGDRDGTWSGMTWNKERFPDPVGLTRTLHDELHVKLMNSIWPSVGNDTELAHELDAHNLRFLPLHWISKKARIYDAYSPEGRAIYFKYIKQGLLDVGVDALWMDGTEVEVGGACHDPGKVESDIKSLGSNAMGDFTRYLNPYSLLTTKGTYEGQRATGNKRVFTLTRSAFTGQQRYAAMPWSGDTNATWVTLQNQIAGGINVGMSGLPYWTQDTGGFFVPGWPGGEKNPAYRELFDRWHQFGIFNPIYRIHGTNIERELYVFKDLDPEVYKGLIDANHLRYRLIPYIYGMAWMSTDQGYTMMRGLPMDFPDDPAARKIEDEYMFGSILVHPITRAMYRGGLSAATTIPVEVLTTPDGKPGLTATYFQGRNFEQAAGTSVDSKVDYNWPGPPLAEPPAGLKSLDNFSARWQGTITAPEEGEYEIGTEADDGERLWLDDKLVVDDWSIHPRRFKSTKVSLKKGQKVAVKIEYFNGTRDRSLRLAWKTPSQLASGGGENNVADTYLPAGADWYDFWTNERFTGGQKVSKACPLDILPLYVRAGSIIPMSPVMQYVTEKPDAPYEIRIYPGADAKFTLYEDDNETYDYEKGKRATYELSWNDAARTLTLGNREGTFPGMIQERQIHVVLAAKGQGQGIVEDNNTGQTIHYDGKEMKVTF